MSASMFDQWPQANQSFLEPLIELNNINMRIYGDVARENIKAMNDLVLCHAEQVQQLSQAKKLEEVMAIQANLITNASKPLNTYAQHMLNTMLESASIYSKWLEKGYQKAQKSQALPLEKHKEQERHKAEKR
ncbi:MAG: phasin family protein [Gammaproteobacteria bacterium]|jgi:hypothetical protein|nr:phasin family protein [Gammaproteobacteria bacterium]